MWWDDEVGMGRGGVRRRRRPDRRDMVLDVRVLSKGARRELSRRATKAGVITLLAAIGIVVLAFGVYLLGQVLFVKNPRFRITSLEIRDDGAIASYFIRQRKGIAEGTNLFAFSIAQTRQEFLEQRFASKYRSMEISRVLPGTLVVSITERVPLARVGAEGNLVVDREGCVFGLRAGGRDLPVITGYPSVDLKPGVRLQGTAVAALQVLEACDDPKVGIAVGSIDVDAEDHLAVYLKPGSPANGFKLSWKGMGARTRRSRENLGQQLQRVCQVLQQPGTRRHSMLDATYEGRIYGSP